MQILESSDLVDSLKSHIAILNEQGKIIAVNKSWEEFGIKNGLEIDCLTCNYIEVSERANGEDSETGKMMAEGIRQVLSGASAEFALVYPCHSPNKKRWFNAVVTPFKKNNMNWAIVCHTDITQIKCAKEILKVNLKEISGYKLALIESSLITITDHNGVIVYLNNNFCESTGYYISELLGQDLRIINSGFHTKTFMKDLWNTIGNGKIWKGEINNKTKSGKEFWLDMTIIPFLDDNGTIYQFVSVSKDITHHKKVVQEQEALNLELRLLSAHLQNAREEERIKMAREIHDELGQQLTAIKINIDWICHKGETNLLELKRKAVASLQIINETIKSVKGIVADLRPALLDDLGLEAAIEFYVQEFSKRTNIICSYESSILDAVYSFHANIALFRICQESLTNVASHAHATKVSITLYENDGMIILEIIDNGIGIKEKDLRKVNSFGLIGMKERVGILGGKFEITPFFAPWYKRNGSNSYCMKILIVDDHAIVRKGLVDLLKEEFKAAEFSLASNSEEAIYRSMNGLWDLILLDITLPGRSGLETLKQLRTNNIKAPILMLSMLPESQYAMRALKAGASGYVNKDSATEELVNAVYKVLSGRKYLSEKLTDGFLDIINKKKNSSSLELLSDRELEVMKMIAAGETLSTIAELMSLSISTISTYRARLLQKMHLKSNADIIRYVLEN